MYTAITILIIALAVLSCGAAVMFFRYARKQSENEQYASELDAQEKRLQKRKNDLDRWQSTLNAQLERQNEWDDNRKHIYANFEVLDSEEDKPTKKAISKSLSSKIGYALRKEFPEIQVRHDEAKGGRTVYSVDFYVTPYGK